MGITTDKFFENIYSVIFSPKTFFYNDEKVISVRLALATLILTSLISMTASGIIDGNICQYSFIFKLLSSLLGIIILWFTSSLFFEYVATIFAKGGKLRKILFYTAFATVPYVFYAPLNLLKLMGELGYILASYAELLLYFWIIFLLVLALSAAYKITKSRSFMLIFLPFVSIYFAVCWMISFIFKIGYIFSI